MPQLKNYREVGVFDLISAPLNPIGAFDAEQFKKDVRALLAEKKDEQFLAVDLTGLDFVYSDAYNAFIQFQQEMEDRRGMFAVLTNNKIIVDGLRKAGLDKNIKARRRFCRIRLVERQRSRSCRTSTRSTRTA